MIHAPRTTGEVEVLAKHGCHESSRFPLHRLDQIIVEAVLRVEANIRIIPPDMTQIQPVVRKIAHKPLETRAVNQTIGLAAQNFGVPQALISRQARQLRIGTRVHQEMRQTRGDGIVIAGTLGFSQVQKMAGTQECLVARQQGVHEWLTRLQACFHQTLEFLNRLLRHRLACRTLCEASEQAIGFPEFVCQPFRFCFVCSLPGNRQNSETAVFIKQHTMGRRRPLVCGTGALDLQPLNSDSRLASWRK